MHSPGSASDLIAVSFDAQASPSFRLQATSDESAPESRTWGLAWYPDNQRAVVRLVDTDVPRDTLLYEYLQDSQQFRSSFFVGAIAEQESLERAPTDQPFVRSFAGRQWVFAVAGSLSDRAKTELDLEDAYEIAPVGNSTEEHAFCWLLSRMRARSTKTIDEFGWRELHRHLEQLSEFGQVDIILSDGIDLCGYRDPSEDTALFWSRLLPPHEEPSLDHPRFGIRIDTPLDVTRTLLLFSSKPMRGAHWRPMEPGELRVVRRGSCVWSSHPGLDERGFANLGVPHARPDLRAEATRDAAHQQQRAAATEPEGRDPARRISKPPPIDPGTEDAELTVVHITRYRYQSPVERSSHRFCLRPVHDERQTVLEYGLDISVDGASKDFEDVFGNQGRVLEVSRPYETMEIASRARVRVNGISPTSLKWPYQRNQIPLVWMPWQRQMMEAYLLPPELPEPELRELSEFGMSFVERNDFDLVDTLFDLNRTIYRDFSYVPGSTTVETTPFAVYTARKGVCQDFANVFICVARLLGVPARYRVGYIYTGGSYENKIQSDASHAWAEVYLPLSGWFGLDPTNGCLVGPDHVRVACGRQFRDAAPTAGTIYRGGGYETLEVDVRVEKA